ncbi:MAG: efflux RND transporter periplasmic adaptor subunit [Hyphomicrobium sp.]|nr:efflux RND transporter periplasmic adaptor subunit [Hyphomicrobium sp.]
MILRLPTRRLSTNDGSVFSAGERERTNARLVRAVLDRTDGACLGHVLALATLFVLLGSSDPRAQAPPGPLPVTVAPPLAKRVTLWDEYSGRFEAVERVEVRPRVSGFIESVHFKDGGLVKAGDLLFTLDKRPFEIAVESAKADIARQQSQVELTKADVDRAEPLAKSKVLSEQVFDQRKAALSGAEAQLLSAQSALKSAELNLEWADVRAPIAGRISDKKVDPGNLVAGGQAAATLLATIVTTDPIHFVFDVSEADYLRYARLSLSGERTSSREVSNPVRLKLADEEAWGHDGKMDFVDNALNERSGTLRGRAVFNNADGLLTPGVFARLALFGGESDAFLVPDTVIVSDQARKIVFTVNADNVVVATPVTLGPMIDGLRVIKAGLKAEDQIVIEGLANPAVRPGAKVAPNKGAVKTTENQK